MRLIKLGQRLSWTALTLFVGLIQILSSNSFAQENSVPLSQLNPSQSSVNLPSTSSGRTTQVGGFAKTQAAYYPSPISGGEKLNQSINGEVNFLLDTENTFSHSKLDVTVGKYFDWEYSYFSVQQMFTAMTFNQGQGQISLGRRLEFWSQVDKDWQLGLWEPLFKIDDPLLPVDQGLTGIFYQQTEGHFDWLLFGSPIFIPTMSPPIREENGSLVGSSRWYQQPASTGNILQQPTQFVYSLSVPELGRLVNNPGSGIRLRWADSAKAGVWVSANYGYKPINTLQVKYDANLVLGGNTQVQVVPVVAYAKTIGGDLGFNYDSGGFSVSYLEENPVSNFPTNDSSTDWWQQQPGALKIYAAHLNSTIKTKAMTEKIDFSMDYLRVLEELTVDKDSSGVYHNSILPYQTMFTNAFSVKTKIISSLKGKRLVSKIKALRDFDQKGNVYGTEFDLDWTRRWTFNAGVDILSPDDVTANNKDPRFINQFRTNDRIYGGFNYVF